jgi:hypothetical protein
VHGRDFLELKMNQNLKAGFDSGELRTNDWWLRAQFPHPCAWGALQLFGEHGLSFVREEIEPALQR